MAEAILRVRTEGGNEVKQALGVVHGAVRASYQAMNADARRHAKAMAAATVEAFKLQQKAVDAACKAATASQQRMRAVAQKAAEEMTRSAESGAGRRRRALEGESRESLRSREREVRSYEQAEARKTRRLEAEVRRRRSIERDAPGRGRSGGDGDSGDGDRRSASGRRRPGMSAGDAVGLAERGLSFFAGYGDDLRQAQRARNELEHRATLLASTELNTPSARGEIMATVQRENMRTGASSTEIMAALERAQGQFSALGDAAARATYLREVFPMLTNAALASGTSLVDMVDSAGEFQRQMNISAADMPRAIAGMIAQGRFGSISARDQARHMGVLAGGGARYLSNEGANSAVSNALVGALFQTAGQAGGGGDVAATRARAFQDNFTSDRGRERLKDLIGYNAFDRRGQLRARDGETQADAFARLTEDAYRASRGNATRFGVAMGGVNTRSRALTDQLFRDLSTNGGRLRGFRNLVSVGVNANAADTDAAARDALSTDLARSAQRDARAFWSRADPSRNYAAENQATIDELRASSPMLGAIADNSPGFRGAMDVLGAMHSSFAGKGTKNAAGAPQTRMDLYRQQATTEVMQRENAWRESADPTAWVGGAIGNAIFGDTIRARQRSAIEARTAELAEYGKSRGVDVNRPLTLAPNTTIELGPNTINQLQRGAAPQAAAFDRANAATGAAAVPPEHRSRG